MSNMRRKDLDPFKIFLKLHVPGIVLTQNADIFNKGLQLTTHLNEGKSLCNT